ncbi:hypothetical protein COCOBI_10-0160 [Coccomyxa sp. Obi]|nr:hypothetical protein COCOBI_10-0160 [Coccomyxa sp. Obi]
MYKELMKADPKYWGRTVFESAEGYLPVFISRVLCKFDDTRGTEGMAVCRGSDILLGQYISFIRDAADYHYKLTYVENRDSVMSNATPVSPAVTGGVRPDYSLVTENRHIGVGEDKQDGDLSAALRDVMEKAAVCNRGHFDPVDGTFAYAAAGHRICFIFLDLDGKESHQSTIFDIRDRVERAEVLKYIAGIYRALLVAKEAFRRNPINPEDAELIWMSRPSSKCETMRYRGRQHELRFFKRWNAKTLEGHLTNWCTTMENFQQAYSLGTGTNGLPAAKVTIPRGMVIVNMQTYGANLERFPPKDEQSYKAASCGVLKALSLLHDNDLVHCDVRAPNVVWFDNAGSSVVLVDLDMACKVGTAMPEQHTVRGWDVGTLDVRGRYGKASDVYAAGKLLKRLAADQPWAESAAGFCDALISKQVTASGALAHGYLAS